MKRPVFGITFILLALALATPPAQAAKSAAPFVPNEVLVQFRDGTTEMQQQAARDRAKAAKKEKFAISLTTPPSLNSLLCLRAPT